MDAARLESIPLFAQLSRKGRKAIAQHADEVQLAQGTKIIEEGGVAYELFVIESGTADVLDGETVIAQIGPGDVVGEIGLLHYRRRTASVVATSPIDAIVMFGPELMALKSSVPQVFEELERLIAERTGSGDQSSVE
ncbi:MAG TPA: cyclic nucleotide-binding domain-containing protein [Acidimicrobiia bacterium]|nr:cyclic nucleotide-binding domain-containing protein [Acidimicrobiia bacterium]